MRDTYRFVLRHGRVTDVTVLYFRDLGSFQDLRSKMYKEFDNCIQVPVEEICSTRNYTKWERIPDTQQVVLYMLTPN